MLLLLMFLLLLLLLLFGVVFWDTDEVALQDET